MDENTFLKFQEEVVNGIESKTEIKENLRESELNFYRKLKSLNEKNRLEQEKIPQEYVLETLKNMLNQ
jgi:hypothetical protein